MVLPRIEILFK